MKLGTRITLLLLLLPVIGLGADEPEHITHIEKENAAGVEALSPNLRYFLAKEMQALQTGMMSIIPAYASGNYAEIESTAKKMRDSFILKQSLTAAQAAELHSVLSAEFIEKDKRFHYLAGMLAHAASNRKPELINFYFSELNESCVGCHTAFARHRFPAFAPAKDAAYKH